MLNIYKVLMLCTHQHRYIRHHDCIIVEPVAELRLERIRPLVVEGQGSILVVCDVHFLPFFAVEEKW